MASPQLFFLLLLPLAAIAQKDILMIFGGYTSENFGTFLDTAESVELGGDGACTGPQTPLPFGVDQNVGLVTTDGNILSCGGSTCFPDACPCVVYNRETDAWDDYFTNMRYARSGGSSSVRLTDGRYFIIGETGDDPACFNSEIFDGEVFLDGPVLPHSAWDSCVVEFEPNVVFITGGFFDTEKAYLINVDSAEVTELPDNPEYQWIPACGVVGSPLGGKDIVVAGGNDNELVNIYNTELNAWRPGPPFSLIGDSGEGIPALFLEGSRTMPYEDSFIVVGGRDDVNDFDLTTIYQYDPVAEDWILRNETLLGNALHGGRGSFGMVMVDEKNLNC